MCKKIVTYEIDGEKKTGYVVGSAYAVSSLNLIVNEKDTDRLTTISLGSVLFVLFALSHIVTLYMYSCS